MSLCSMPSRVPACWPTIGAAGVRDVGDPPGYVHADAVWVVGVFEAGGFRSRRPRADVELEARDVAVVVGGDAPVRPAFAGSNVFKQVLQVDSRPAVLDIAV